ncbi:MAG: hypothetical protein KDB97_14450, partial [Flavobacteriales bacterium]|nr:hypothetical protein [Flavobacteriales bacterium]
MSIRRGALLPFLAVLFIGPVRAQAPCGTQQTGFVHYPPASGARGGGVELIPTVVHVHYGGMVQPVGPLTVEAIIDTCNRMLHAANAGLADVVPDFQGVVGDAGLELRLATIDGNGQCMSGIQYHPYDPDLGPPNTLTATLNTRNYLNIHILPAQNSFAVFPGLVSAPVDMGDVIVLSTYDALFRPDVLAHEVGHWGGLYHTWGNTNASDVACGDDYIADTPETAGSPVGSCDTGLSECTPGVVENVQNVMDYSECRLMFTQGQADHVQAVLADTTRVRHAIHLAANLLATGVTNPPTCALQGGIYHRRFENCAGTTVEFTALATGGVPDSLRWTFTGGTPTTSAQDAPDVLYTATGSYDVQLVLWHQGQAVAVQNSLAVNVPNANANGLPLVTTLPFTEDFENGFGFPQPHMVLVDDGTPTWEPFSGAGFASSNCLRVPAEALTANDTSVFLFGNCDLSGLVQPAVRFRVAASYYPFSSFATVEVLFRDLCSSIFTGNVWYVGPLYDWATDHGPNYVPQADSEWHEVVATFPVWNLATSAEFGVRLRRPSVPGSYTPEAFYLDDLYVGEADMATAVPEMQASGGLLLMPNPARDRVRVQRTSGSGPAHLEVL